MKIVKFDVHLFRISFQNSTLTTIEEKLKEKFETMGLAFLCLSIDYPSLFNHWCKLNNFFVFLRCKYFSLIFLAGIMGIICFSITVRLAYVSLFKQLEERATIKQTKTTVSINLASEFNSSTSFIEENAFNNQAFTHDQSQCVVSNKQENTSCHLQCKISLLETKIDNRVDKVYTIGCFDLFHEGHRRLLERMREYGHEVIVGVHDSRSIYKLKNRVPIDGTETRMLNVKRYADQVYCVAGTDPSNFIMSIVHLRENETALYIRGDDMANFPSRHIVEQLMPIKFLPYTVGVSSTKLRKELFSHVHADDIEHLEKVN